MTSNFHLVVLEVQTLIFFSLLLFCSGQVARSVSALRRLLFMKRRWAIPAANKRGKRSGAKTASSSSSGDLKRRKKDAEKAAAGGGEQLYGLFESKIALPSREEAEAFFAHMLAPLSVQEFEEEFEGKQVLVANNENEDEEEGEDGRSEDGGSSSADFVKMNVFGDWHGQLRDILNSGAHQGKIVFKDDVLVLPRPGTCPRTQGTSSI